VELTARQQRFLRRVVEAIEGQPVNTPSELELARALGTPVQAIAEIIRLGKAEDQIIELSGGILYSPAQIESIRSRAMAAFGSTPFAPKEFRHHLITTRRYADALLSYFDEQGFTARTEHGRIFVHPPSQEPRPKSA
jgi:hypothetical protein